MGLADEDYSSSDEEGAGLATPRRMLREPALSDSATQWMTEEVRAGRMDTYMGLNYQSIYPKKHDIGTYFW